MEIKNSFLEWWEKNYTDYKVVLFDVDGTVISGSKALPNAEKLLGFLEEKKIPFYLLTNDGNHSTIEKSKLIAKAGINIESEKIISCAMAINSFVSNNNFRDKMFFVMGSLGNPCYAESAGLKVCRDIDKINLCSGVIVGEGTYNWQENINAVINTYIHTFKSLSAANDARCADISTVKPMVVPNPDSYWPNGKCGEIGIGAGGKARFICSILKEMGINLTPVYLGKPYKGIFEYTYKVITETNPDIKDIPKHRIIMIGDSLMSDIKGSKNFGIQSALVLTGITMREQITALPENITPDLVFEHL